jgi:hypothetical protein
MNLKKRKDKIKQELKIKGKNKNEKVKNKHKHRLFPKLLRMNQYIQRKTGKLLTPNSCEVHGPAHDCKLLSETYAP